MKKSNKLQSSDPYVRREAVMAIDDDYTLGNIAKTDKHWTVRCAAVEKITSQEVLLKVLQQEKKPVVITSAISVIKDEETLLYLFDLCPSIVREVIVTKLNDQIFLKAVINDTNEQMQVRINAMKRLDEDEIYKLVIADFNDSEIADIARSCIKDIDVLIQNLEEESREVERGEILLRIPDNRLTEDHLLEKEKYISQRKAQKKQQIAKGNKANEQKGITRYALAGGALFIFLNIATEGVVPGGFIGGAIGGGLGAGIGMLINSASS